MMSKRCFIIATIVLLISAMVVSDSYAPPPPTLGYYVYKKWDDGTETKAKWTCCLADCFDGVTLSSDFYTACDNWQSGHETRRGKMTHYARIAGN